MIEPLQLTIDALFPNGVGHYAAGGLLIGLGVAVIYAGTGIIAGASTFLESTWSYVSSVPRLNRPSYVATRDWRVVFTLGIVGGASGPAWARAVPPATASVASARGRTLPS